MQTPVATFDMPLSTGVNVQDPTTYKGLIDGDFAVMARIADQFAPHANSTPDMRVYLDPGHIFNGTSITEVGAFTQGTVTNGSTSVAITGSVAGISGTMLVSGPGIPANTTATIAGSTVTLSQAAAGLATSPQTSAPLKFMQRTSAIVAPVTNPRIDRIVINQLTGAVSIIAGAENATPVAPAITGLVVPVAQVRLATSTTSITNSLITDERDLASLGDAGALVQWATAGGTGDAITATYPLTITAAMIIDGLTLGIRLGAANTLTNPTFAPDGNTARTITKRGGAALQKNDLPGALAEVLVRYNLANTRWELLNPGAFAVVGLSNTFIGAQISTQTTLTSSSASIAVDFSLNNEFIHTFTENTTLANPSNCVAGQSGSIQFTQHASSPKTLAFGSNWKFPSGTVPSVTATNSAKDTIYYNVRSSTVIEAVMQKGFA